MKQLFPAIWGNEDLCRRVGDGIINGTLSHAYAIQGPSGTGKRLLASQIAAALVCENRGNPHLPLPCGECRACRMMLTRSTPDLTVITREDKATIGVEKIRRYGICRWHQSFCLAYVHLFAGTFRQARHRVFCRHSYQSQCDVV